MSDDTDVDQLLENLQSAIEALNKIDDVEGLISKLDAKSNRKLLKKVKNVVSDVHGKVNVIKDRVSKAYKRVKVRGISETEDSAVNESLDKDVSDNEVSTLSQRGDLESRTERAGRYSPVIGTTRGRRFSKRLEKEAHNDERVVANNQKDNSCNSPLELIESNKELDVDNAEHKEENAKVSVNKDETGESDDAMEGDNAAVVDNNSSVEIIENTPPRTPVLKLSLRHKNKGRKEQEISEKEILDDVDNSKKAEDNEDTSLRELINKDVETVAENVNSTVSAENVDMADGESQEKEKSASDIDTEDSEALGNMDTDETEKSIEPDKDEEETGTIAEKLSSTEEECDKVDKELNDKDELPKKPDRVVPKIKLVDINKLLAPNSKPLETAPSPTKGRKSVTFDNSVIVLTSSDEDTPKKNPKEKDPTPLKSALRKSSSKIIDLSDSDSKENNENLRNTRKSHRNAVKHKKVSSDQSSDESDFEEDNKRSRRLRRHVKDRFSNLVKERGERRHVRSERKPHKDEVRPTRKTKRTKTNESSESEEDLKTNATKRRKKELLEQVSLSDGTDNEDNLDADASSKTRLRTTKAKKSLAEPDPNDPKFKSRLYVKLHKLNNEGADKEKNELVASKKLSSRHEEDSSAASVDAEKKPENKKIKLTLKLNRVIEEKAIEEKAIVSSDDDRCDRENNERDEEDACTAKEGDTDKVGGESLPEECQEQVDEQPKKDAEKKSVEEIVESDDDSLKQVEEIEEKSPSQDDKNESVKEKNSKPKLMEDTSESEQETNKNRKKKNKAIEEGSSNNKKANARRCTTIETSDSDDDFAHFSRKKDKKKADLVREAKKRMKKKPISDSESEDEVLKNNAKNSDGSDEDFKAGDKADSESSDSDKGSDKKEEESKEESKPARRRIKRIKDSSSDDEDKSTRKQIRKMIDRDSLSETTKKAEQEEKNRKSRILEKQKKYNQIFELKADATVDKVVLDFDEKTNKPLLSVHKKLVKQLKPHQVLGVKFMWDACFESLDRAQKTQGSGCILAHCMGLGKTLQVIALVHALLTNSEKSKVEKILVVCPVNTVLNWKSEFRKWLPDTDDFEVYELVSCKTSSVNQERNYTVKCWHEGGGVLIIGYSMFRTLSNPENKGLSKKLRQSFQTGLVDPGPDLVICDEGHLLKNEKTNLSIAMNRIKTLRRIVLTGTPLQNNLREYWCMVQFIKPNLLGTYKEYLNRFVNPIINGQYTDSTQHDIMIMRRRSHVLHKLLDGVVQRQDYAVLEPYLPPKYEYVLFLKLTDVQIKLYQHYIDNFARHGDGSNRTSFLFADFQQLQRICTHPRVLLDKSIEDRDKKEKDDESESEGSLKDFIVDGSDSSPVTSDDEESGSGGSDASVRSDEKKKKKNKVASTRRARVTRAQAAQKRLDGNGPSESEEEVEIVSREWFDEYISRDQLDNINHSAKIFLLFQILKECEEIGDKILVFSQSLYALNCIEYFLARIDEATQKGETDKVGGHAGSWCLGLDYFRLDGSSSCDNRASWCDHFNDPENTRARLFLISTKAGGLGINLVAANRVIIFDVSWNPSHDIQSIYRVYRFGQTKPSYIYRFVTYGAMEMKIYERQVTKQAISKRVIDEQQIDRHYSQNDIQELYKTDLKPADRPIPMVPKDVLLGEMVQKYDQTIYKYHEHQSLLENKQDEELNEDERKAAWEEFENEKVIRKTTVTNLGGINMAAMMQNSSLNFSPQLIQMALGNIVRKDNPNWSDVQIKGILPALVAQLQMQMSENDFSMYNRVQQEIRLMQAVQAQRMRENYIKQYQLQQMLQKQHLANQLLGNMNITPEELRRLQMAQATQNYIQPAQASSAAGRSSDVIELND